MLDRFLSLCGCCTLFRCHRSRVQSFVSWGLSKTMKYVLVTGGVVSGLGKGVTASSIGLILKACGLRVTSIKIGSSFLFSFFFLLVLLSCYALLLFPFSSAYFFFKKRSFSGFTKNKIKKKKKEKYIQLGL